MKRLRLVFAAGLLSLVAYAADDFKPEPGFVALFNGKDLTGWCYTEGGKPEGPITDKFDEKMESADARYSVANGALVVHPKTPRQIAKIWTQQSFAKDFVLRLEFRATYNADSGIYVRGPQLQCRDYLVAGPDKYKLLKTYKPQDWNFIEIIVKDGAARCTCNGELLEEAMKVPAAGPIGLEGDRGMMEYRRIRIKEMP